MRTPLKPWVKTDINLVSAPKHRLFAGSSMSAFSPFVLVDPTVTFKPGNHVSIRSRCMQGKNKRVGSRRSNREQRKIAKSDQNWEQRKEPVSIIPKAVIDSSVVYLVNSDLGPEARHLLNMGMVQNFTKSSVTPLERCVDFDKFDSIPFRLVFTDAAYLNSILCSTSAIHDLASPTWNGQPGRTTALYLCKTLSLLRDRVGQRNVMEDEAMLYAVIQLAVLAAVFGDWEAAIAHISGLQKIVQLRGGIEFLRARPKLRFKLDR